MIKPLIIKFYGIIYILIVFSALDTLLLVAGVAEIFC